MSLDYPFYEELCRRKHPAAWWWIVGDRLYYLGPLAAICALGGVPAALLAWLLGYGWTPLVVAAVAFPAGVLVFLLGSALKGHSYELARRDGIEVKW